MNNVIADNTTTASGGGVYCFSCSPDMVNNTFAGNQAGSGRGGAIAGNNFQSMIVNSILWGNSAPSGPEIGVGTLDDPIVTYCDVQGGWSGQGNIDTDPLFVDLAGGDYRLTYSSPCRDAGDDTAVVALCDFEGDPRIAHGAVDMGADEFHTHLYWMGDATPGGQVALKIVDIPSTTPVILFVGSGMLATPIHLTKYGDWYLEFPLLLEAGLGSVPADGVLELSASIPSNITVPVTLPMQALSGMMLTNPSVMTIE